MEYATNVTGDARLAQGCRNRGPPKRSEARVDAKAACRGYKDTVTPPGRLACADRRHLRAGHVSREVDGDPPSDQYHRDSVNQRSVYWLAGTSRCGSGLSARTRASGFVLRHVTLHRSLEHAHAARFRFTQRPLAIPAIVDNSV